MKENQLYDVWWKEPNGGEATMEEEHGPTLGKSTEDDT